MTPSFIALAGNPNSGKSTAFNWYTGSRQHVGNYPGITVERKEGIARLDGQQIRLIDLPGSYSLTAYSPEELVSRQVLAEKGPGAVLNVVNASVLERNLFLTVQLLELGLPTVIALNMADEARNKGIHIDPDRLATQLDSPVVPTVARTGEGLPRALRAAAELAGKGTKKKPLEIPYGDRIESALAEMIPLIDQAALLTEIYPARWTALKLLERDQAVLQKAFGQSRQATEALLGIVSGLEARLKAEKEPSAEGLITDRRYAFIAGLLADGVLAESGAGPDRTGVSDKLDTILTHRIFGFPILLGILYLMYWTTFSLGEYPAGWLEAGVDALKQTISGQLQDGFLKSLLVAGIVGGVGSVLSFVPLIMIMFMFIAFLEDSGYMARVAYVMDRIFRLFGLHGASVMPFIVSGGLGGGCAVPGVMATRTLRSPRERLATMLTAPFLSCGAKIPVFLLLVSVFFSQHQELIMFLITLSGWAAALFVARLLRSTIIRGPATPFVMELPPYRLPTPAGVLIHTWERTWQYIRKAGTIILAIAILMWAAMTFPGLDAEREGFYEQAGQPYEHLLGFTPSSLLTARIEGLRKSMEEIGNRDQELLLADLEAMRSSLPTYTLPVQIKRLEEEIEELGPDPTAEALLGRIDQLEAALSGLPEDHPSSRDISVQLEDLRAELETTGLGRAMARLQYLREGLDQTPEMILRDWISGLENQRAAEALENSYAGRAGRALEPLSRFAGFDWRTNIALIGGIAAKEVVVSTLGTAYSLGEVDEEDSQPLAEMLRRDGHWTKANGVSLILFTLLYSPCFVTLAVIRRESGSWKWVWFSLFFNLTLAYGLAVCAFQLLRSLG